MWTDSRSARLWIHVPLTIHLCQPHALQGFPLSQLRLVFCCLSQTRDHQRRRLHRLSSYRWWIHSSLTRAVEGIRLNRTGVNSIVFVENRYRTLFHRGDGAGADAKKGRVFALYARLLSFIHWKILPREMCGVHNWKLKSCWAILFPERNDGLCTLRSFCLLISNTVEEENSRLSGRIEQVERTWIFSERVLTESRVHQDYMAGTILSRDSGKYNIFLFDLGESERLYASSLMSS